MISRIVGIKKNEFLVSLGLFFFSPSYINTLKMSVGSVGKKWVGYRKRGLIFRGPMVGGGSVHVGP